MEAPDLGDSSQFRLIVDIPTPTGSAWPWPEENGKVDETNESYPAETIAVFAVLRSWFLALEDGSHVYHYPDPAFIRANGKPPFTEAQLESLVTTALDAHFNAPANRSYALTTRGIWHDAGPDFARLAAPQRLALAQELSAILEKPPEAA